MLKTVHRKTYICQVPDGSVHLRVLQQLDSGTSRYRRIHPTNDSQRADCRRATGVDEGPEEVYAGERNYGHMIGTSFVNLGNPIVVGARSRQSSTPILKNQQSREMGRTLTGATISLSFTTT